MIQLYPDVPYDPQASDKERIAWLESRYHRLESEQRMYNNMMDRLDELISEISTTTECTPTARSGRPATLATYWRGAMWMDCYADIPDQIEYLFQGLVGAAFDAARKS